MPTSSFAEVRFLSSIIPRGSGGITFKNTVVKSGGDFESRNIRMSLTRLARAEPRSYGEIKKPKQFMNTDSASALLDRASEELGVSSSEVLEWFLRGAGVEITKITRQYKNPESKISDDSSCAWKHHEYS